MQIVVGTQRGVFVALDSQRPYANWTWTRLGGDNAWGVPNTLIADLQYSAHDDVLFAAALGRGVWQLGGTMPALRSVYAAWRDKGDPRLYCDSAAAPPLCQRSSCGLYGACGDAACICKNGFHGEFCSISPVGERLCLLCSSNSCVLGCS